jgi:hypothetical protein
LIKKKAKTYGLKNWLEGVVNEHAIEILLRKCLPDLSAVERQQHPLAHRGAVRVRVPAA